MPEVKRKTGYSAVWYSTGCTKSGHGSDCLAGKKEAGSPVLFTQLRPGKGEKIFKMYKFRTMTDERDARGNLLPDEQRLTEFGKVPAGEQS